jgi:hypothetical protein
LEDVFCNYIAAENTSPNKYFELAIECGRYSKDDFYQLLNETIHKKLDDPTTIMDF